MNEFFDMHSHLSFVPNMQQDAQSFVEHKVGAFIATVTPQEYMTSLRILEQNEILKQNFALGLGLHPWWISDGRATTDDLAYCLQLLPQTCYLGEIGLDKSQRFVADNTYKLQINAFRQIANAAATPLEDGRCHVLSIHAVKAVSDVLDILEDTECIGKTVCVFHWYSGSSEELHRAIKLGCYFSVNPMCLTTKRWKEYGRIIPLDKLLLETDYPPQSNEGWNGSTEYNMLQTTFKMLHDIRSDITKEQLMTNSNRVFNTYVF